MGPRFCKRGNFLVKHIAPTLRDDASMGPRFCKRGNRLVLPAVQRSRVASMGPRFCKRGNGGARSSAAGDYTLQWGHAFVSVETEAILQTGNSEYIASMGPRFCKRGNLGGDHQRGVLFSASMGPRFCKRGNVCHKCVDFYR